MSALAIDLTKPSVNAARELARRHAMARMQAQGRDIPGDESDKRAFHEEYARLLWAVSERDGGFLGIDDEELECRAKRLGIPFDIAAKAVWAIRNWPGEQSVKEAARARAKISGWMKWSALAKISPLSV